MPSESPILILQSKDTFTSSRRSPAAFVIAATLRLKLALNFKIGSSPVRCSCAGSVRRMQETVGDIDLIAASERPEDVIEAFLSLGRIRKKQAWTERVRGRTPEGVGVELWVVPPEFYGAALVANTGIAHSDEICRRALKRIYGVFWGLVRYWQLQPRTREKTDLLIHTLRTSQVTKIGGTEEEIYEALGMQWIHPTLREGRGEVKAALKRRIPRLVELSDVRGDLHCQSKYGSCSIRELALAAAERGYEYLAFIDLPKRAGPDSIEGRATDSRLNEELQGRLSILYGVELGIGLDGDIEDLDRLQGVELVIASIHDGMDQSRHKITHRLLKAIEHPRVNIISIRWPGEQKLRFDLDKVCQTARRHRVALKIDANIKRIDLPEGFVRRVIASGAKVSASAVASRAGDLANVCLAVAAAQRGWATAEHVVNTWPIERLREFLAKPPL